MTAPMLAHSGDGCSSRWPGSLPRARISCSAKVEKRWKWPFGQGSVRSDRVALLGNGIDIRRFDRTRLDQRDLQTARKELGLVSRNQSSGSSDGWCVKKEFWIYSGRCASCGNSYRTFSFSSSGRPTPTEPDAIAPEVAKDFGVAPGCVFTGMRMDMPTLYALMDVFVLPSYRESFPRVPMEASAMGVPCVVTDIPGCREVVEHGRNGLLVPAGNAEESPAPSSRCSHARVWRSGWRRRVGRRPSRALTRSGSLRLSRRRMPARRERDSPPEARQGRSECWAASSRSRSPISLSDIFLQPGRQAGALFRTATVALCLLLPLLALVALLVRCTMGAPALFRQRRPGLNGAPFVILKFRTMRQPDERAARSTRMPIAWNAWANSRASSSLDELPQVINVLKGDMSFVGPRPAPHAVPHWYLPAQARRHEVKPGVTGWAQINGRNALSWDEKLAMDVGDVDHHSFWLDLKGIPARTIRVVVRRRRHAPGEVTVREFLGAEP